MRTLRAWLSRFAGMIGRRHDSHTLKDELDFHLQLEIDDNIRAGNLSAGATHVTVEPHRRAAHGSADTSV